MTEKVDWKFALSNQNRQTEQDHLTWHKSQQPVNHTKSSYKESDITKTMFRHPLVQGTPVFGLFQICNFKK